MVDQSQSIRSPSYEKPWLSTEHDKRYWYHSMSFPDGEAVRGSWTIENFDQYIGGYDLNGKTVLDVGTASGFLAFNAERSGAVVTGFDAATTHEFRHFPFASSLSYKDIITSRDVWERENLIPIKNSWWYAWRKFNSQSKCVYAPMAELYEWPEKMFDVVMAGAIVEHLSDPVYAIGAWARLAKEAVLIPFTNVLPLDDLVIHPITNLDNPNIFYVWWHLSRGLYTKIFDNLGFDIAFTQAHALHNDDASGPQLATRPSIIATRRR
ncbi:class I SAM-dependent methyltransferase [Methylobacterium sp. E-066]|uniref:class I SAM-dependent methyltransferase n=1 Tax=Methylobacterium sp. E-066 TaxID=2836584 RepID=UPI001FBB9BB1|nr:methyltransferase domain-containing protein [Methylobacterium sp. E-066]MCJ2141131.1 hypothetical protein [Methylobacterium sp. E-066]